MDGIQLSHIFEIFSISNEIASISMEIPSILIKMLGNLNQEFSNTRFFTS